MQNTLAQIGYPSRFVKKRMNTVYRKVKPTTVSKKQLFLKLQFNREVASEVLNLRLSRAIRRTYAAATLCLSFSKQKISCLAVPSPCTFISSATPVEKAT